MNRIIPSNRSQRSTQRGAVLYIALIMLVLLALIGIVGMQVAGLQERMSANYMAVNSAFEAAESSARLTERAIKTSLDGGSLFPTDITPDDCVSTFDPAEWNDPDDAHVRRIDECFPWSQLDDGYPEQERTDQIYQVTAFERDAAGTAEAVINTTYIP